MTSLDRVGCSLTDLLTVVNELGDRTGLASKQRGHVGDTKAIDDKTFGMALSLYQSQTATVREICAEHGAKRRTF